MTPRYGAFLLLAVMACGPVNDASSRNAPAPPPPSPCKSLSALAPEFFALLDSGQLDGLKRVIELSLSRPPPDDPTGSPPVVSLLRGVLRVMEQFADDPPEPGGNPCAALPPPAGQANRLCVLRRLVDKLLLDPHQLDGIAALGPLIETVLGYLDVGIAGTAPGEHYGVTTAVANLCKHCDAANHAAIFTLIANLLEYLRTPLPTALTCGGDSYTQRGPYFFCAIQTLLVNPDLAGLLQTISKDQEQGRIAMLDIIHLAVTKLEAASVDSTYFDGLANVFDTLLYPAIDNAYPNNGLHADVQRLEDVLRDLLDPANGLLQPIKLSSACLVPDPNAQTPDETALTGAIYDLAFGSKTVQLDTLMGVVKNLLALDPQGQSLGILEDFVKAFAASETNREASADACYALFEQGNAPDVVPSLKVLIGAGVVGQLACAVDQVMYGCQAPGDPPRAACMARQ